MGDTTKISWTNSTFNPWQGCTEVSPACDDCYAKAIANRFKKQDAAGRGLWDPHADRVRTSVDYWKNPLKWQRKAHAIGRRWRVFCASMADVFDNQVPKAWREDLWTLIRECPDLDWQLLTKRPQNIRKMLPPDWGDGYPNVWLGTTAESQQYFDQRWPALMKAPAVVRFISYEPALGPLVLGEHRPDWLICGSESGRSPRLCDLEWVRSIRDQCADAGVAFFWKRHFVNGKLDHAPEMDGRTYRAFPR